MYEKPPRHSTDVCYQTNSRGTMIVGWKQMFFPNTLVAGKPQSHHNKKASYTVWQRGSSPSVLLHPRTDPLRGEEFRSAVTFLWASAKPVCWDRGVRKLLISSEGGQSMTTRQTWGRPEESGRFEPQPSICWSDVTCRARADFRLFSPEKNSPFVFIQKNPGLSPPFSQPRGWRTFWN